MGGPGCFEGEAGDCGARGRMEGAAGAWNGAATLEGIRARVRQFADDRDWAQYHTPRNLLLALVGEVGELSEIFQWKGEVDGSLGNFTEEEKVHLGEELSDVFIYTLRLSDVCGIDLGEAAIRKLAKNAEKYSIAKCKGKATKYDKL